MILHFLYQSLLLCVLLPRLVFGFPVNGVLDTFTGNSNPPTGWTDNVSGLAVGCEELGGFITKETGAPASAGCWWNASSFGALQEVYAELGNYAAWTDNVVSSLLLCVNAPGDSVNFKSYGIRFQKRALTDHLETVRLDISGGVLVFTQFGADQDFEMANLDDFGIETTGSGQLSIWGKQGAGAWTQVTTRTETGTPLNCTGTHLGVQVRGSDTSFDNLGGGTTVAPATATNPFIRLLLR